MDQYSPPASAHTHPHFHRTLLPDRQRSAIYWHTHEHAHVGRVVAADEYHTTQAHDHVHDRQAMDALTVVRVAA